MKLNLIFVAWIFFVLVGLENLDAGAIYYFCDENGVFHFTDLPSSDLYRPFIIFSDKKNDQTKINEMIKVYSKRYGLDYDLVRAVVQVESAYKPEVESRAGAQGLMQIMPQTQEELGLKYPFDPASNLEAGVRYLRSLIDRFGDVRLALAAYNAGPSKVEKYNGIPPYAETKRYVQKVLNIYSKFKRKR
ncbi:lytic transglycosylase domain-containing protein [Desulfohalobiaceae bacterium Ax17]|uniref:lytic transglycosylase domain-containing protein n=1 Tax=Desulfovulcanus ferrireducens TaxID=2831190 RepID=UPI00207BA86F|nr:lytic transglycosylase domain-containing protein [Desulfovulcanus ferrireducens]MBT8764005.1 lytic transglycosylase domain-containing protein [Desulfovulcanus ferrireducens]